jgi:hypothetical protein
MFIPDPDLQHRLGASPVEVIYGSLEKIKKGNMPFFPKNNLNSISTAKMFNYWSSKLGTPDFGYNEHETPTDDVIFPLLRK